MKKENVLCSMEHIDSDLIEEAESYKKSNRKNTWIKWGAMAACLCLVVAGVLGGSHLDDKKLTLPDEQNGSENISTQKDPAVNNGNGVYIPAVELPTNTEGVEFDMLAMVVYHGGIYTQAEAYYDADAERINDLVGDYLGYATGSINEWSTQDEYAKEFASSCAGDVYSVKGYDTDFRVCIR
jgi:hypothetical protein